MEITKLDINWGGAGFPAYEGLLRDGGADAGGGDPEPMDSEARGDAALAMFQGGGADPNAADPNAADPNAADPAADPNAADPNADDPNAGQLTEEQLAADPRYQELSTFHDSIQPVLDQHGVPDAQELGLQLADSRVLYEIMQGKGTPSQLLDVMAQNSGWNDQQKQGVAQDLIGWLTKNGYLKDGQAAAGDKKPAGSERTFDDPLAKTVKDLQSKLDARETQEQSQQRQAHQEKVFKTVTDKITEFAKQKGVADPEDHSYYIAQVAALVNGNAAILSRVQKGNFVDIQKFFTQVHNAEVKRLSRFSSSQTRAQAGKAANPRIPAGGAPPAPSGQPSQKLATNRQEAAVNAERRRQAAMDQF